MLDPGIAPSAPGRGDDAAGAINHKQLGKIFRLAQLVHQRSAVETGEITAEMVCQFSQVFPLLAGPVVQQLHAGFSDGFEGLFDHRVRRPIEPARPAHGDFSGFAEPG
ncbi:hypothetical protein D3C87_1463400 [compost metagenome]